MLSPEHAITIIDADLEHMLRRPGMYVGGGTPECHHCFFLLLLQLLSVRAMLLGSDFNWQRIAADLLVEVTGEGSGSTGPNSRLADFYGAGSFSPDDPNHGAVMSFWREFVTRMRAAMKEG